MTDKVWWKNILVRVVGIKVDQVFLGFVKQWRTKFKKKCPMVKFFSKVSNLQKNYSRDQLRFIKWTGNTHQCTKLCFRRNLVAKNATISNEIQYLVTSSGIF